MVHDIGILYLNLIVKYNDLQVEHKPINTDMCLFENYKNSADHELIVS
jgi:hypothetical protein